MNSGMIRGLFPQRLWRGYLITHAVGTLDREYEAIGSGRGQGSLSLPSHAASRPLEATTGFISISLSSGKDYFVPLSGSLSDSSSASLTSSAPKSRRTRASVLLFITMMLMRRLVAS